MADLPIKLQSALETLVSGYAKEKLEKDARAISEAYRLRTGEGKRLLTAEGEAAAYAAARMPATYAAAYFALSEAIEASGLITRSISRGALNKAKRRAKARRGFSTLMTGFAPAATP